MYIILYITKNNMRQHFSIVPDMDNVEMLLRRINECTEHGSRIYCDVKVYKLSEEVRISTKSGEIF